MPTKTEILLAARQHFRRARTTDALQKIDVPEWGCEVYYWPEMDVEEKRAVFRHLRMVGGSVEIPLGDLVDAAITQVCLRARDAFGNRLFSDEDAKALADTDPEVLQRVANEMGYGSRVSLEDAEKN